MIRTTMLLGLLCVPCTLNAQEPAKNAGRADRIRALQGQIMVLEAGARTRVLQERGAKQDQWISRATLLKALDPCEREKHQDLLYELTALGSSWPKEIKSGPQVGDGVDGRFAALFLNGDPKHAGKQRCPV